MKKTFATLVFAMIMSGILTTNTALAKNTEKIPFTVVVSSPTKPNAPTYNKKITFYRMDGTPVEADATIPIGLAIQSIPPNLDGGQPAGTTILALKGVDNKLDSNGFVRVAIIGKLIRNITIKDSTNPNAEMVSEMRKVTTTTGTSNAVELIYPKGWTIGDDLLKQVFPQ